MSFVTITNDIFWNKRKGLEKRSSREESKSGGSLGEQIVDFV